MEPTRASGSGEPRERLDSAEGEEPEVESLEIIGQEMVPYAGGRRPPRRMAEVVPVESNLEGDTPGGGQLRPRYLPMENPEPEGQMMKMMAASQDTRTTPSAPGVDPVYLMQMMQELMTRNQRLQREVEVLKKQGKETDADYGTPESREKVNGMITVRDNQSHEPYGPTRDHSNGKGGEGGLGAGGEEGNARDEQDGGASERASEVAGSGKEGNQMDVMLKLMEGMQMMQKQLLDQKEKQETIETVKAGFTELPRLGEFSPENGLIDLGDWFTIIHPLMSDLSDSSMEWWDLLLKEAREWYEEYMKEIPLNRVNMVPKTPEVLGVRKWSRLESRSSSRPTGRSAGFW